MVRTRSVFLAGLIPDENYSIDVKVDIYSTYGRDGWSVSGVSWEWWQSFNNEKKEESHRMGRGDVDSVEEAIAALTGTLRIQFEEQASYIAVLQRELLSGLTEKKMV